MRNTKRNKRKLAAITAVSFTLATTGFIAATAKAADGADPVATPTATSSATPSSTATPIATASATATPTVATSAPTTGTSVVCPAVTSEITKPQADAVYQVASTKLAAAARGSKKRYPFGALANQVTYVKTGPSAWTSGFYPGELWLMYQQTKDDRWLKRANQYSKALIKVANDKGTHDLGFMIGLPMGLAHELEPTSALKREYLNAEITAAKSLARRYSNVVHAIKSANYNGKWGVIIDSAMNAPMMIQVGQWLGAEGNYLANEGEQHMLTLANNFIRPNGSTFHRMAFNPKNGMLIGPIAGQGLEGTSSTWSRGQAWAINGFAQAYELTKNPAFLKAAEATANYWMSRVPPGCIPAWDLDVSNNKAPRDSSAAAIAASGLLTLARNEPSADAAKTYNTYARLTLGTLATPGWLNTNTRNPGILLQQSLNVPALARDGSYVWGDFYLLQALAQIATSLPTPTPSATATQIPAQTPASTATPPSSATPKPSPTD
ncbi:MAG: glycoside hydrolase family 88 protein [Candidatus Nanopelagicales bacterium]|nr:glycoside hydrolase family 88 protein [Candidatus Nanopelagicales bacterium]